jgi:hypothetical protein
VVGLGRLELPTSRLSSARSNQLSYKPVSGFYKTTVTGSFVAFLEKGCVDGGSGWNLVVVMLSKISGCSVRTSTNFLRKEVIQPQVPLRLPCYDFTPVTDPTVVGCLLAVSAPASGRTNSHGVTGGVYKARERIHRGMLIRDY